MYTKKVIVISLSLIISLCALGALFAGIFLLTRDVPMSERDSAGASAAQSAGESKLLNIVTGNRSLTAKKLEDANSEQNVPAETTADKSTRSDSSAAEIPRVTGLRRLSEKADSIRIGWDDTPGVSGYRIYHRDDNDPDADFTLFSTVRRAGLNIRNLSRGSKYSFRIVPFITNGNVTAEGEATEVTFGTAPTDVEGFHMTDETADAMTFVWKKNDRADGYLLERCYKGEWSDYQTFDADTTEFTDSDLKPGSPYNYRICAFREDSTGKVTGAKSSVRTVAGLVGPKDNGSASKLGIVALNYQPSAYADGYRIYSSKDKKKWEKLAETEETRCGASQLDNGETYYFRIYPYKTVGDHKVTGSYTEMEFVAKTEIYGRSIGGTYVQVSLDQQHMWYVVDGEIYLDSDCVTGNYNSLDTPKGYFEVNAKMSPCTLKGDDYETRVTYWMPFIGGGWGLHDAGWRSRFGGNIYKGDGSHGCVNLPYDVAKKLYAHIEVGTPVIVY